MRREGGAVGTVHVPELAELLPHAHGESGRDGGAQGGRLVHRGSLDGDLDDIGLGLVLLVPEIEREVRGETLTCMQISELLIPPSTASSVSLCPLSISMASRMALVWKQAASMVARAMCPF